MTIRSPRVRPARVELPLSRSSLRFTGDATARPQSGFVLLSVLVLVALMLLALSVAAPKMAEDIRRDRDQETIQRGKQYIRAIRLYYKRFGKYPDTIDELEHTNDHRFLRRRYLDPITGKDDWRIIHLGEAKIPPMGMFGQPIGLPTMPAAGQPATLPTARANSAVTDGPTPVSSGAGTSAQPGDPGAPSSGSDGTATVISMGQIVGIGVPLNKASIKAVKGQDNYSHWEFVYSPAEDPPGAMRLGGSPGTAQNGTPGPARAPQPTPSDPGSNGDNPLGSTPATVN